MELASRQAIVVLTGAGISKESGLETFRDEDGIWSKVKLEDVATPEAFQRDPALVQAFYNQRRRGLLAADIGPNAAHTALARLERDWPGPFLLVTQNIDDLHERAGSKKLIHMHGELLKALCLACGGKSPCRSDLGAATPCPHCGSEGQLRPDVVWFGEMPYQMERIYEALGTCGLFVSTGTSGTVYPAAGFAGEARQCGAQTAELNLERSGNGALFSEGRYGPATQIVPAFVDELLSGAV
ncbi:MAG: NAD-dependent protein deacylase [Hyphomicrobiales bacterium]|nr:MAG: NAD-dependent protein deacylase [Hyphomicrobiales bacterium]